MNCDEIIVTRASNDGYLRLAGAVLLQAVLDAKEKRDAALRVEALTWLAGPEASAFCEALEVPDIFPAVVAGGTVPPARGWRVRSDQTKIKRR